MAEIGLSQNQGSSIGVPIVRTLAFWDLYWHWGPAIHANYPVS